MQKLLKRSMLIATIAMTVFVGSVSAEGAFYTNKAGVEMTELQYNKMISLFSERKVEYLTQEDFNDFKDVNVHNSDVFYEKTIYENGKVISTESVSEEEYNNAPTGEACTPYSDTDKYVETAYKRFSATIYSASGLHIITNLSWKKIPAYTSFDVYAMRFQFMNYSNPTGQQDYYVGNGYTRIRYNTSSEGYKGLNTGFGYSMNLKDGSNITGYELALNADLSIQNTSSALAHAYVTYQHAQANLTRAQSMSYTMDVSGLGNVLYYSDAGIRNAYDNMAGLHLVERL